MKVFVGLLMLVTIGISARAQEAKALVELARTAETIVKNSPFSADAVSESVQTLADGNRIVRSSTSKLYRNGEGRFRREMNGGSGGMLGSFYSYGPGVTILDPVIGYRYQLDTHLKTAEQALLKFKLSGDLKVAAKIATTVDLKDKVVEAEKLRSELRAISAVPPAPPVPPVAGYGQTMTGTMSGGGVGGAGFGAAGGMHGKYESRTEQLGMQNIEGVEAEGTRTITTIPAGAIGNERPIDIVYERWYSKELQMIVMSKHSDPRSGEQTYRLTNINRSEPDPSLFSLPTGYKVISDQSGGYRVATTKAEAEKAAASKGGQPGVTYVKTKPQQ